MPGSRRDRTNETERVMRQALRWLSATRHMRVTEEKHIFEWPDGTLLFGHPAARTGTGAEVTIGPEVAGRVYGPRSDEIAEMLSLIAGKEAETRQLVRDSLDRYGELATLYALPNKIAGTRDPAGIAAIIAQEAATFLGSYSVSVLLVNDETGDLECAAAVGNAMFARTARRPGSDIVGAVLTSGDGEIVNDLAADTRGLDADMLPASAICSPLRNGDNTLGVLIAGSSDPRDFNAGELQWLNALAALAATALEVTLLDRRLEAGSRKPAEVIYGLEDKPPFGVALILGFQQMLVALLTQAYPVLIAIEAGGTRLEAASLVTMSLIAMAICTVLQTIRYGPVGSGLLAPSITSAIFLGPSMLAAGTGGMPLVFGMTVFAGVVGIMMARVLGRYRKLFPPEVSGVVVLMVGLSMIPVAVPHLLGIGGDDRIPEVSEWGVGLLTLGTILFLTVLKLGQVRLYATAIGLAAGYGAAWAVGLFDQVSFATIEALPIIGFIPPPWHGLQFDLLLAAPFVAAALASNIKDAGLFITIQKANDTAWKRPDTASMSGGLVASGLGNVVSGTVGGVGLGVSAGGVGLAIATGAMARRIGYFTAAIFVVFAFLPQATAALAMMPSPVMGAGLVFVACHLIASGIQLIASRMLDARRIHIIGIPIMAGVGLIAMPELAALAPGPLRAVVESPLTVSMILVLALNLIFNLGVSSRARAAVPLDGGLSRGVAALLDRQGASWGARLEVIRRAVPAVTEWCEELRTHHDGGEAWIELSFDEFTLRTIVTPPRTAGPCDGPRPDIATALDAAARAIAHRYGCATRALPDGGRQFNFEQ